MTGFLLAYLFAQLGREATDAECVAFIDAVNPALMAAVPLDRVSD